MQTHVVQCDPAAQSSSDGVGNPASQLVHGGPEQKQDQEESRDGSHSAPGSQKSKPQRFRPQKFHLTILKVRDQRVSSKK